jgi:hypothetical protein
MQFRFRRLLTISFVELPHFHHGNSFSMLDILTLHGMYGRPLHAYTISSRANFRESFRKTDGNAWRRTNLFLCLNDALTYRQDLQQ